jgi:hypothetical protein
MYQWKIPRNPCPLENQSKLHQIFLFFYLTRAMEKQRASPGLLHDGTTTRSTSIRSGLQETAWCWPNSGPSDAPVDRLEKRRPGSYGTDSIAALHGFLLRRQRTNLGRSSSSCLVVAAKENLVTSYSVVAPKTRSHQPGCSDTT